VAVAGPTERRRHDLGRRHRGEPASELRFPPAVAVFADGTRAYGITVPGPVAADVSRAFGQPCWYSLGSLGELLVRHHDGEVLASARCVVADAPAPVEGRPCGTTGASAELRRCSATSLRSNDQRERRAGAAQGRATLSSSSAARGSALVTSDSPTSTAS
jgi:hypothetical protein